MIDRRNNKSTGRLGEEMAAELLQNKGYEIVERNWRSKWGEIDLICNFQNPNTKEKTYVFVEVKTKVGKDFGSPEEMINKGKLLQVQRMASVYSKAKNLQKRIDVVAVVLDRDFKVTRISHYECVY